MNILIIGSGAREHALAWKIASSPQVTTLFVAPGNGGTELESNCQNIPISASNIPELLAFAKDNHIDLTIVGPEAPLALGIYDAFCAKGLQCIGPSEGAAQLESSKAFTRAICQQYRIPCPKATVFCADDDIESYLKKQTFPLVLKADGLAAGKGVFISNDLTAALDNLAVIRNMGQAGQKILVEEYLSGEEVSFIALTDGTTVLPLASSQDHKTRDNQDKGPMTGGMGAYSPARCLTPGDQTVIIEQIMHPALAAIQQLGYEYKGFLYAGIMLTRTGPKLIEFNCRLGDPEAQVILPRLKTDLLPVLIKLVDNQLHTVKLAWEPCVALTVVVASNGYPGAYRTGKILPKPIFELDRNSQYGKIFHAGTKFDNQQIVSTGGRVLSVTALGKTTLEAKQAAYQWINKISWEPGFFRTDIGDKAISREQTNFERADANI